MRKLLLPSYLFLAAILYSQNAGEIRIADEPFLDSLISSRNGKPLLLNVWATWCIPCKEEFPDLIKLSKEYEAEIEFVGLSIDYPDEIESRIIPFIRKQNVGFPVIVNGFKKDEKLINFLNEDWGGSIPATFIYNSDGDLSHFIEGKHSYSQFKNLLSELQYR